MSKVLTNIKKCSEAIGGMQIQAFKPRTQIWQIWFYSLTPRIQVQLAHLPPTLSQRYPNIHLGGKSARLLKSWVSARKTKVAQFESSIQMPGFKCLLVPLNIKHDLYKT